MQNRVRTARRLLGSAALGLWLAAGTALAADAAEDKAVIAAVQKLFDGMAAHDGAKIKDAMLPDTRLTRVRGDQPPATATFDQFVKGIEGSQVHLLERMWDPKVLVRGRIAALWAEYDFHADGKLTHCGVDSLQMIKTSDGWKISAISYTVETDCAPSPLGPPK